MRERCLQNPEVRCSISDVGVIPRTLFDRAQGLDTRDAATQQLLTEGKKAGYALTAEGKQQAARAGQLLLERIGPKCSQLQIIASPFSRTVETAEAVCDTIGIARDRLQLASDLRERNFGAYELQSHDNYSKVWAEDLKTPDYRPPGGGESVREVSFRLKNLLESIEAAHQGVDVLLVSHGDTCSILWAVVKNSLLERHRDIALKTGELRQLHQL